MSSDGLLEVAATGLGLWMPGYPNLAAWTSQAHDEEAVKPVGTALDRVNRRRAGVLGRAIADAAGQAIEQSGIDPSQTPCVVGSSIGEADAMIALLDQMWRTETPLSPATFTVSVHNASSGLLSISSKNQGYVTSLAADEDTPAMALLEGAGLVHERGVPVLVVCGDEAAPSKLVKDEPHWGMLAAAIVIAPAEDLAPRTPKIAVRFGAPDESPLPPATLDDDLARSPQAGLVDLLEAISKGDPGCVRLDRGLGRGFVCDLSFAP